MPEATGTQLTRHSQELTIFHDVAKALTSSLDLDSILQTIMEKMAEYFRPDTWSLLMVDESHDELYFAIAVGDKADVLKDFGSGQFSSFKNALVELCVAKLSPIASEMKRLVADPGHVDSILIDGADRARVIADETMRTAKDIVGFIRQR